MKKHLVIVAALGLSLLSYANPATPWMVDYYKAPAQLEAGCPSFPTPAYNSLTYNVGCIPWDLEWSGAMSGDVNGAVYTWYRYKEGSSQSSATPCAWQTDFSSPEGFKPATDENNSRYIYFCKVTTPNCPSGVNSAIFTVVVGSATDPCWTLTGTSFTITSGGSYSSGQTVTITATTTAYGGDHIYTWYHNGEALDVNDPRYTFVWGFNQPQLIISNVTPADGGTYSVMMQDGTECFMYTDPVRILVDNPSCGPNPTLAVQYSDMAEGGANQTGVSNNTLASGEVGTLVYMVQPDGSNPTTTAPGTWTTDQPGLYQFKYVVDNPNNPSCYRESKVVTVRVYDCGDEPTITPAAEVMATSNQLLFTVSPLGEYEKGSITFTNDKGQSGTIYPNTYPNFGHTCYSSGTYTYTYTVTNTKAPGCTKTATCTVLWYFCGYVTAKFNDYSFLNVNTVKVGTTLKPTPAVPTESGMIGVLTYRIDGGAWTEIPAADYKNFVPTTPGTYEFKYVVKHSDPRVTDCYSEKTRTIVVEPCGTKATLSTNKTVMAVGESATLTISTKASGETATLTYSKDGGAQSSISNLQSPITFTPTEEGVYVFTYTITPSGCDATTAQVTIRVYDCGSEASITASQAMVQPGGTITLNLSAPGADEAATLTYTVNGGANNQLPINNNQSSLTFTPTEEGIYVFTYAITHAYINCSRSAQTTVRVYNCGAPAGLATDKNTLKLGESATLTLSRQPVAADGETASLTYTLNGGSPSPITANASLVTFTPTEVGTYVVTYAIDNATLGCATSAQVTINVYDCGPEAAIALSESVLQLGQPVTITLSDLGADETGTLTVSKDGGTPSPVTGNPSPITFTPTELGVYVFTYTITHPYINCTRTATATMEVYDCGTPAAVTTDKAVLKLGESAKLTLSTVLPVETATLTYSVNGGAQSSLTSNLSPLTFTPTELGVYVFTYTVSHTKINCETSAQVTINVYDCGPDASINISATEIKIMRPVTITLSDLGTDEAATLTYSVNGGTQSPLTSNPSPITFTPTELGTYTFTYTITHPYINCTRTATATLQVIEAELVFDDNNGSHVWSDPKNWWPAYNRIPNAADSAVIRKSCNVDTDCAVAYDVTIDMASGTALTIQPNGALVVLHHLLQSRPNAISVQADPNNNGALVLGPENTDIPANVAFFARSTNMEDLYPVWQYMGLPIQEQTLISTAYPEAVFYEWTNTPNRQTGGNWQRIDSLAGSLLPFTGYCMTQKQQKIYTLQGTLNNPVRKEITLSHNDQGAYPDFTFVANSWVAPIDIASMDAADFGVADATVYIMNTGTYEEAIQQQSSATTTGTGTARGQYNTIPVHAAAYLSDALTVIPPMQGFFVHTKQPTTLVLDYNKAVYTPALTKVTTTPTRAPQNLQSSIFNLKLSVSGYGAEDEVNLLVSDDFSPRFENGWDGYKARSEKSPISMAVQSADGPLAVAAIPELEGTEIAFDGGNHKAYTITVTGNPSPVTAQLYLLDKETGSYTELIDGATYTFKCGAATRRFEIVRLNEQINDQLQMTNDEPYKFIQDGILYIRQGNRLYNATGELISQ